MTDKKFSSGALSADQVLDTQVIHDLTIFQSGRQNQEEWMTRDPHTDGDGESRNNWVGAVEVHLDQASCPQSDHSAWTQQVANNMADTKARGSLETQDQGDQNTKREDSVFRIGTIPALAMTLMRFIVRRKAKPNHDVTPKN